MESNSKAVGRKYIFIDLPKEKLEERDLMVILYNITGCVYVFAQASDMMWGENGKQKEMVEGKDGFFQIMPQKMDDGFFDWYCDNRQYYQFFETMETCALHFINYWYQWKYAGLGEKLATEKLQSV